jgi:chromosome partitioning protein
MGESLRSLGLGIVAIANQKGGVGKTTTAIEVSSGLARSGARVLAVDGDPQGDLSLFFGSGVGASGSRDFGDLLGDLIAAGPVVGAALPLPPIGEYLARGVRKGLDLVPARHRLLRRELAEDQMREAARPFASLLRSLRASYDWIVIDSSPSNGALERLLVGACEAVIVPLEFQIFSVAGLQSILDEVGDCAAEAGRGIRVHALAFTKAENRVARVETYREIFSTFRIPIFEVCKSEYIPRSLERSRTIWESGPSSFAARDYARMIEKAFLE